MTAYVVLVRESTKDKTELATYAQTAPAASQGHQFVRKAFYGALEVLERG
jgi:hypothetical protein